MEILTEGHKALKQKSKRVDKIDDVIRTHVASLTDLMIKNNGVGIAAPQCGIHKRIIVISDNERIKVFINPEILFKSDELEDGEEGCLSIPGKVTNRKRHKSITIKYRNLSGHPHLETYNGFTARIIQHEIDHLDGILMTDEQS